MLVQALKLSLAAGNLDKSNILCTVYDIISFNYGGLFEKNIRNINGKLALNQTSVERVYFQDPHCLCGTFWILEEYPKRTMKTLCFLFD